MRLRFGLGTNEAVASAGHSPSCAGVSGVSSCLLCLRCLQACRAQSVLLAGIPHLSPSPAALGPLVVGIPCCLLVWLLGVFRGSFRKASLCPCVLTADVCRLSGAECPVVGTPSPFPCPCPCMSRRASWYWPSLCPYKTAYNPTLFPMFAGPGTGQASVFTRLHTTPRSFQCLQVPHAFPAHGRHLLLPPVHGRCGVRGILPVSGLLLPGAHAHWWEACTLYCLRLHHPPEAAVLWLRPGILWPADGPALRLEASLNGATGGGGGVARVRSGGGRRVGRVARARRWRGRRVPPPLAGTVARWRVGCERGNHPTFLP